MATIYNVYASDWGGAIADIDLSTPIYSTSINPVAFQLTGDGTRYIIVRKSVDGIEEKNTNVIAFTLSDGEWAGNVPDAPVISGTMVDGNIAILTWNNTDYNISSYNIYEDSSLIATVPYAGIDTLTYAHKVLASHDCTIKAKKGNNLSADSNTVTLAPDTTTTPDTADGVNTWLETIPE